MKEKINFLCIGAQKCATSWLYYCLRDHPELYLPKHKKEIEYIGGELYNKKGIDWYLSLWNKEGMERMKGDVSVDYLFDANSPELVKKHLGNVKLIISLRNPIDRLISAYYWSQRSGEIPSDISLNDAVSHGVEEYYSKCSLKGSHCKEMITRGLYYHQIKNYLRYFPKKNLFIILFNDVIKAPLSVVQRTYKFLGVSNAIRPSSLRKKPKKNSYSQTLVSLERKIGDKKIFLALFDRVNQLLSALGISLDKADLSDANIKALKTLYRDDISELSALLESLPLSQVTSSADLNKQWIMSLK